MPQSVKALEKHLIAAPPTADMTSPDSYAKRPASAFLVNVCDAEEAFAQCLTKFTKKNKGQDDTDSEENLRQISLAIIGTLMGHFETFEKALFAGLVERSIHFPLFAIKTFIKELEKHVKSPVIDPAILLAFRNTTAPVGFVIADSLKGWHDPANVNSILKSIVKTDYFSGDDQSDLSVLWQLRHSIVHTGSWLTLPDAQKVQRLRHFGDSAIAFDNNFITVVARRFHQIVKASNQRLKRDCVSLLGNNVDPAIRKNMDSFLGVTSLKNDWLRDQ